MKELAHRPARGRIEVCAALAMRAIGLVWLLGAAGVAHAQTATAVEYHYADWDHYFVTSAAGEIAALDGRAFGGVWKRTGETFTVGAAAGPDRSETCRFFSTSFAPRSSHFYTPFPAECANVKASADWQFENVAFYLQLAGAGRRPERHARLGGIDPVHPPCSARNYNGSHRYLEAST